MPDITCPECETTRYIHPNSLTGPVECHGCGHVFTVEEYYIPPAPQPASQSLLPPASSIMAGSSPARRIDPPGTMVIECPGCKGRIKVPASKAGVTASCPRCKTPFAIPVPPEEPVPPAEAKLLSYSNAPPVRVPPPKEETRRIFCPGCGRDAEIPVSGLSSTVECSACNVRFVPVAPQNQLAVVPRQIDEEYDEPVRRQRRRSPEVIGFVCPYCGTDAPPTIKSEITQAGWVTFFVLLSSCLGIFLCWIGFLLREDRRICSQCGIRIGG